jgi:hypothetical protein
MNDGCGGERCGGDVGLEGPDALFDDELVDGDVESYADASEGFAPLSRPVVGIGAAEEVVPNVLRLPEVDLHRKGAEAFGDFKGLLQGSDAGGGQLGLGGAFEADHGALHAPVGGVTEKRNVEGDVVDDGATKEA